MKIKKIIITSVIVSLTVISSMVNMGYGVEMQEHKVINGNNNIIVPFWNNINDIILDISAEGNTIYADAYVSANSSSASINGTVYLQKYVSGTWTNETSWPISGTSNAVLSKSYKGKTGNKYRLKCVVTVNGETVTVYSGTCDL